jgi:hypothetical protein
MGFTSVLICLLVFINSPITVSLKHTDFFGNKIVLRKISICTNSWVSSSGIIIKEPEFFVIKTSSPRLVLKVLFLVPYKIL